MFETQDGPAGERGGATLLPAGADPLTGSCSDGIDPRGLNLKERAEPVLAYRLSTCAQRDMTNKAAQLPV